MIPKIIHYSWLSGEPYPTDVANYISRWHRLLPDYEFVLWDSNRISEIDSVYMREAIQVKKWACAADFIRTYAVYKYGGIWLDTDMELFKPLDSFLNCQLFIGREARVYMDTNKDAYPHSYVTAHCFGAIPGHPFLKDCLSVFQDRHFIRSTNNKLDMRMKYDMLYLPRIYAEYLKVYGFNWQMDNNGIQEINNGIVVYPHDFFDMPGYNNTKNVFAIHCARGEWLDIKKDIDAEYAMRHRKHRKWWWLGIEKTIYTMNRLLIPAFKIKIVRVS